MFWSRYFQLWKIKVGFQEKRKRIYKERELLPVKSSSQATFKADNNLGDNATWVDVGPGLHPGKWLVVTATFIPLLLVIGKGHVTVENKSIFCTQGYVQAIVWYVVKRVMHAVERQIMHYASGSLHRLNYHF